jgi:hypothetical protein
VYSRKWAGRHDAVCPFKVVPCARGCGDGAARRAMEAHRVHACPLRPVPCSFHELGCLADLVHRDLPDHLERCIQGHLMLTVARVGEQQQVIQGLHRKVANAERQATEHAAGIAELAAGAVAGAAALAAAEKGLAKLVHDEVGKAEARAVKRVEALATEYHMEVGQAKKAHQELGATVAGHIKKVAAERTAEKAAADKAKCEK